MNPENDWALWGRKLPTRMQFMKHYIAPVLCVAFLLVLFLLKALGLL